jgi:hypothetical protein
MPFFSSGGNLTVAADVGKPVTCRMWAREVRWSGVALYLLTYRMRRPAGRSGDRFGGVTHPARAHSVTGLRTPAWIKYCLSTTSSPRGTSSYTALAPNRFKNFWWD